jgi:hypothetical protein
MWQRRVPVATAEMDWLLARVCGGRCPRRPIVDPHILQTGYGDKYFTRRAVSQVCMRQFVFLSLHFVGTFHIPTASPWIATEAYF